MDEYRIVKISEHGELKEKAAEWFHQKWGIPKQAYLESMEQCIKKNVRCSSVVHYS